MKIRKIKGGALIEFAIFAMFAAFIMGKLLEDGGILDDLKEYDTRFVNAAAAP